MREQLQELQDKVLCALRDNALWRFTNVDHPFSLSSHCVLSATNLWFDLSELRFLFAATCLSPKAMKRWPACSEKSFYFPLISTRSSWVITKTVILVSGDVAVRSPFQSVAKENTNASHQKRRVQSPAILARSSAWNVMAYAAGCWPGIGCQSPETANLSRKNCFDLVIKRFKICGTNLK